MDKHAFAAALKLDREDRGWSQSDLGRKLGVPSQSVSRWESAMMAPRDLRLVQIVELLGQDSATAAVAKDVLAERQAARARQGRKSVTPATEKLLRESHAALDRVEPRADVQGVNLTGYYYDRRERMRREIELGVHERTMDVEEARREALKALHEFEIASEHLADATAWLRVLSEHMGNEGL